MDGRLEADRKVESGGPNHLRGLLVRDVRLPAPGIVPEDSGRQHPRRGQREAAEGAPHEVPDANCLGERLPQRRVRSRGTRRVEEDEVRVLLRVFDKARPEPRLAEKRFAILRQQIAREVDASGAELGRDRRGGERGPELDPIEVRSVFAIPLVAFENDPVRLVDHQTEGPGSQHGSGASVRGGGGQGDGRPPVGQERRVERQRLDESDHDLVVLGGRDARDFRRAAVEILRHPRDRGERGRHEVAGQPDRALERSLRGRRGQRCSVRKLDAAPEAQPNRLSVVLERPALGERGHEVALRVGRHERLDDVRDDLALLRRLVGARLQFGDGVCHRDDERPASRNGLLLRRLSRSKRCARSRRGNRRPWGTRPAGLRPWPRSRGASSAAPFLSSERAGSRPRSTQREASSIIRDCHAVSAGEEDGARRRAPAVAARSKVRTAASTSRSAVSTPPDIR